MRVALLYKVFFLGIVIVLIVIGVLSKVEHLLLPHEIAGETPPTHSGFSEVEFESGEPVKKLKESEDERLHAYHGNPAKDSTVEVPIERAIEAYLATSLHKKKEVK